MNEQPVHPSPGLGRRVSRPTVTVPVARDHPCVAYANASARPQPDPPGRAVRHAGRAARRHRARHVHDGTAVTLVTDWVGDAGRVVEYGTRFTKPVVVPVSGNELVVQGVVKAVDVETGRVTVDVTTTCQGENGRA